MGKFIGYGFGAIFGVFAWFTAVGFLILDAEPVGDGWISVSDRMPEYIKGEPSPHCLIYRPAGDGYPDYIGVGIWSRGEEWFNDEYLGTNPITHWRELPAAPSEE